MEVNGYWQAHWVEDSHQMPGKRYIHVVETTYIQCHVKVHFAFARLDG
jgi:hypothetical protein